MDQGILVVAVTTQHNALPVKNAAVEIAGEGETLQVTTDANGRTPRIGLRTPNRDLSLEPGSGQSAYSTYQVTVRAPGYQTIVIRGVQAFGGEEMILPVDLTELFLGRDLSEGEELVIDIPENTLLDTEMRTPEAPLEQEAQSDAQPMLLRALRDVYIPETISVHLGAPAANARNVSLSFPEYIKNVASSEVYPTWPESALRANIYAQIGVALNRIYTEWYRSRGYNFDITNSPRYDQAFVEGRNIYKSINELVDQIFNVYPRRPGHQEPLFAAFCNGTTSTCAGLSQWGTVGLSNQGYTPLQILRYYYGNNLELAQTNDIRAIEESYPGFLLRRGSENEYVREIQQQLIRIRRNYPGIPAISSATGYFGPETEAAVRSFQRLFGLSADGIVGRATWYQIAYIYAAVMRLAELDSEGVPLPEGGIEYPGTLIREGSRGANVRTIQQWLQALSRRYSQIPHISVDGIFGPNTRAAVRAFQRLFGLSVDGIVGPRTWDLLYRTWSS